LRSGMVIRLERFSKGYLHIEYTYIKILYYLYI
jgi:hypothetical protein